ncbi:DCL family protein [Streptomyces sp. NPDC101213]|uniref:DCL family protein n=1 Tax=Streptomyces sp. NPDC101213 TaxID=3366130 RepID=UPI0038206DC8
MQAQTHGNQRQHRNRPALATTSRPAPGRPRSERRPPVPRGIIIGATHYPTKEAVRNVCRGILQRYGVGGDVTDPDDDAFLRCLLERHPEYDLKQGAGIAHFRVIAHTNHGRKSVGIALVRLDGVDDQVFPQVGRFERHVIPHAEFS